MNTKLQSKTTSMQLHPPFSIHTSMKTSAIFVSCICATGRHISVRGQCKESHVNLNRKTMRMCGVKTHTRLFRLSPRSDLLELYISICVDTVDTVLASRKWPTTDDVKM